MKTINLLPKEEQKEIQLERVFGQLWRFWVGVALSLVLLFAITLATKFYLQHDIGKINDQIAQNQNLLNSSDYKTLQDQVLALNNSLHDVSNLRAHHYYWSRDLIALADLVPKTMQLNQLVINRADGRVDISGQAATRDDVINFWSQVIKSSYFKNINFPLANLEKATVANFNFTFYADTTKLTSP